LITRKTVFVLGAGASLPFGFPLGQKLCEEVVHAMAENAHGRTLLLENTAFSTQDLENFRQQLLYSAQGSVDAFLEIRTEFLEIGKAAMAIMLIQQEVTERLWKFNDNWMRYLFGRMRTVSFDEFMGNNVSFVTFNYDRSLEHFLFTSLRNTYGQNEDTCAGMVRDHIPVIHLHGQLGHLPWQSTNGRGYDQEISVRVIKLCVSEIKVVHEDIEDGRDKDFSRAKQLIAVADHVYCLGFGYGSKNVDRLGMASWGNSKALGTAVGLTDREAGDIKTMTNGSITLANMDCLDLLRNLASLS
jgi:hypothetical protein